MTIFNNISVSWVEKIERSEIKMDDNGTVVTTCRPSTDENGTLTEDTRLDTFLGPFSILDLEPYCVIDHQLIFALISLFFDKIKYDKEQNSILSQFLWLNVPILTKNSLK